MKYTERRPSLGGIQRLYEFENGYGVSAISTPYSYGGSEGLWEIAVLDKTGRITYDTPITDDVVGYLNNQERDDLLQRISQL